MKDRKKNSEIVKGVEEKKEEEKKKEEKEGE